MKIVYVILLIIFVVLACGCITKTPGEVQTVTTSTTGIPDITGTWTGLMQGYNENKGFTDYGNQPMSMVVTEQKGRIFAGSIVLTFNGTTRSTPMTGVIGRDGRTFSMVEKNNGYTTGEIISDDTIELTWRYDGGDSFGAALDILKRE
ncbi:MAG: hypothetical protein JXQ82_10325 [Methanomicrobiaceae archaeon]|nr:hypothetical protein [Methanomicrobiaceae archaeon]